jgi:putative acetyltransferase
MIAALDAYHASLYPPDSNHNLGVDELERANIRFLVARQQGAAIACGALRVFTGYGEVKRMYVVPEARGRGVGACMLRHLEAVARAEGLAWLRLETGIAQAAALGLYTSMGFRDCAPFGDYVHDPLSRFLEKPLT